MGSIGGGLHSPYPGPDGLEPAGHARFMRLLPGQHGAIRAGACLDACQRPGVHLAYVLDFGRFLFDDLVGDPLLRLAKKQKKYPGGWRVFLYRLGHPGVADSRATVMI